MKPGSKSWHMFMQKLYRWSIALGVLGLTFHYLNNHSEATSPFMRSVAVIMIVIGVCNVSIIWFLSMFEPIQEEPNWELVYPELALGDSEDLDGDRYTAEERLKYDTYRSKSDMNVEISRLREELEALKKQR
jgi:hypothetical protein